jgi:hypothetical protein
VTSKKLGDLLRSVPPATAAEEPEPPVATTAREVSAEPAVRRTARASPAIQPEVPLQVLIPANIRRQLALKAADEGRSLRALVLGAIRSLGISVTDTDIRESGPSRCMNS